jgi:hypothetical protein
MKIGRSGLVVAVFALACVAMGCEEEKSEPSKSAPSAQPAAMAPKPSATVAKPPPEPKHDCPEGSSGVGSFNKPCEAKGDARMMEVKWTGKMDDKGPSFRVVNTAKLQVLYGRLVTYFYDKAGKQLELEDKSQSPAGKKPYQVCAGKIFDGPMKAGEKAVITFSCVKREDVPEGAKAIEGEIEVAGFSEDGKETDFYWRNKDLSPDKRDKGRKKK